MSDFVLTIESDDEQEGGGPSSFPPSATNKREPERDDSDMDLDGPEEGPASKKQKVNKKTTKKEKLQNRKNKSKGKGRQKDAQTSNSNNNAEEEALDMDNEFQFDMLGGGEVIRGSSSKARRRDAWDLDNSADLFKRKNAIPRVTVDEIIARRKARLGGQDPANASAEESDEEEDGSDGDAISEQEEDDDDEYDSENESDDEDLELDSEDAANLDDNDNREDSEVKDDEVDEDDEDEEGNEDDDEDGISPFAKLANAATSLSDVEDDDNEKEDEELNFTVEADKQASTSSYFAAAPKTATSHLTSNSASSLPPFSALPGAALSRPIILGLSGMGLTTPTPVQAQTIPVALLGKDIVGSSITGSGKTVAFWVGVLERLLYRNRKDPRTRVVVICPTRELAVQVHNVGQAVARYTDIRFCLCVGGLSLKAQEAELKTRPDVVVSTPGRLIDHVRNTQSFDLEALEILIIDEADRILEEGFKDELQEIIDSCPRSRQTMLFSATITEDIQTLARLSLHKPVRIAIDASQTTSNNLQQEFIKLRSTASTFREATLISLVKTVFRSGSTIIFFRSKASAHRMKILFGLLGLSAEELHGDLTQEMRMNSLKKFREGQCGFLLATDLASRGLDIKGITSVINYEMPKSFDIYLHRVGRTARAGRKGRALTLVSELDRKMLKMALKSTSPELVKQTTMSTESIKDTLKTIEGLQSDIQEILAEEREEKELRKTEMQITKGQNLLDHAEEIHSRPARTWFQTGKEKESAKEAGKREWIEKMGEPTGNDAKRGKPLLNHKQKRRAAALAELQADKSNGRLSSAIKNAKKAYQPGAIRQLGGDEDKRHLLGKADKNKKKKKKSSTFREDLGDKKAGASKGKESTGASKTIKKGKPATGVAGKSRSSTSKKPFKK